MVFFLFIFFVLLIVYGLLIGYYRRAWKAIPAYIPSVRSSIRVSVILAVRNEERNILNVLEYLNNQDYPKDLYEIIIVDDHSADTTREKYNQANYAGLSTKYISLEENVTTKKKAVAKGIMAATGELIITTDADCTMPSSWVSTIASFYTTTEAKFIAGPVVMNTERSFFSIFQSLDFLVLQGITGASVYKQFHTMCNGANLAYPKKVFEEVNGFEGIDHIPSGDDMLLMHKIYLKYPDKIFYLKNKEVIVATDTEKSWKDFFNQRIRWSSKAMHYKDKRIFYVLLLTYLINLCFGILTIACFWDIRWLWFLVLFLLSKIIIEFPFVNAVAIFFAQQRLIKYFPFLQPFHIIYTIVAGWLGRFGSYRWKSRVIKN